MNSRGGVRFRLPTLVLLFFLVLLACFLFLTLRQPVVVSSTSTTVVSVGEVSGFDVALESAGFLDRLRRGPGFFYNFDCGSVGCVVGRDSFVQSGAWVVLAYSGLSGVTHSVYYVDSVSSEASRLMGLCYRDVLECTYVLVQFDRAIDAVGNLEYAEFMRFEGEFLLKDNSTLSFPMMSAIKARELALIYGWTRDVRFLDAGLSELGSVSRLVSYDGFVFDADSGLAAYSCWVQTALVSFYDVTGNVSFLDASRSFFDKQQFGVRAGNGFFNKSLLINQIQPCVEALLMIANRTGEVRYRDDARALSQYLLDYYWDSDSSRKYSGFGGFLTEGCRPSGGVLLCPGVNMESLTDAGYSVYLFSLQPDVLFKVRDWDVSLVGGSGLFAGSYVTGGVDAGFVPNAVAVYHSKDWGLRHVAVFAVDAGLPVSDPHFVLGDERRVDFNVSSVMGGNMVVYSLDFDLTPGSAIVVGFSSGERSVLMSVPADRIPGEGDYSFYLTIADALNQTSNSFWGGG
jgi:hypothetical protein